MSVARTTIFIALVATMAITQPGCRGGEGDATLPAPAADNTPPNIPPPDNTPPNIPAPVETAGSYQRFIVKDPQLSAAFIDVADLNGNGVKEILLSTLVEGGVPGPPTSLSRGALRIFASQGGLEGPWDEQVVISHNDPAGYPFINAPQVMDVNGNGHLDIVVQTGFLTTLGGAYFWIEGPDYSSQIPNTHQPNYFDPQFNTLLTNQQYFWHQSVQIDMDGDGLLDIVTTAARTQRLEENPGNPLGSPDGNEDLRVEWYRNNGNGEFTFHEIATDVGGVFLKLHDLTGNGLPDIILTNFFRHPTPTPSPPNPSVVWLENIEAPGPNNDYQGKWEKHVIDRTIGLGYYLEFADINGNGKLDLVVGNHNNQHDPRWQDEDGNVVSPPGIYWYEIPDDPRDEAAWLANRHTITEDLEVTIAFNNPGAQGVPGKFSVGDITGNGRMDIALPGDGNNHLYALIQREDGSFRKDIVDTGLMYGMAIVADVNGDGSNEIVAAQHNSLNGEQGLQFPPGKLAIYKYQPGVAP